MDNKKGQSCPKLSKGGEMEGKPAKVAIWKKSQRRWQEFYNKHHYSASAPLVSSTCEFKSGTDRRTDRESTSPLLRLLQAKNKISLQKKERKKFWIYWSSELGMWKFSVRSQSELREWGKELQRKQLQSVTQFNQHHQKFQICVVVC